MIQLRKQRLKIGLGTIVKFYFLYVMITGVLVFALPFVQDSTYQSEIDPQRFFGADEGVDRVVLLDDPYLAGLARHDLIVNAQNTIDVAYYSLHRDYSVDAFFGALFEAADRGVNVRILLDGISHGLTGRLRDIRYAILHTFIVSQKTRNRNGLAKII